jgi:hypothetical protein
MRWGETGGDSREKEGERRGEDRQEEERERDCGARHKGIELGGKERDNGEAEGKRGEDRYKYTLIVEKGKKRTMKERKRAKKI